jgi:hypothetical protein
MTWLARLKKIEPIPHVGATEPTKPNQESNAGGFVGFVAPALAAVQKKGEDPTAANDPFNKVNNQAPEPPADCGDWRELAQAYHQHHFDCPNCIACGRGSRYGLRCDIGAALWAAYSAA